MLATIARIARGLLGLIYPAKCLICDGHQYFVRTPLLCENCLAEIAALPLPGDHGLIDPDFPSEEIKEYRGLSDNGGLDKVHAGWQYDANMQLIIHAMKYRRRPSLSRVFGGMLAQRLYERLRDESPQTVLVPVPLHRRRERERGFNQSLLLAKAVAEAWGLLVLPRALRRVRYTKSQARLDAAARLENVDRAFAPAKDLHLENRTVILIDDVFTTGATMNACATALKAARAGRVIGMALAKTGHFT
jgi:ComF family protein